MVKRFGPLAVLVAIAVALVLLMNSRSAYTAFKAKRQAWHEKCDAYRTTPLSDPTAKACNDELLALVAEAKRRGWME